MSRRQHHRQSAVPREKWPSLSPELFIPRFTHKDLNYHVVKIGGSLLERDDWPQRIAAWIDARPPQYFLFVFGGGTLVEKLREIDRRAAYPAEAMHQAAIAAMDINAGLALSRCEMLQTTLSTWNEFCEAIRSSRDISFDLEASLLFTVQAAEWLDALYDSPDRRGLEFPPASWDVTSDSLAAWFALILSAGELTLCKSCLPPPSEAGDELPSWSRGGYVDPLFYRWGIGTPLVRVLNLADPELPEAIVRHELPHQST